MMTNSLRAMVLGMAVLMPVALEAQGGRPPGRGPGGPPGGPPAGQATVMDRRVQERMGEILRQQLGLTDAQAQRMQEMNRRLMDRRIALGDEERQVRMAIRREIMSGDTTRGAEVARLLERVQDVQRRRMELLQAEQQELSAFLTPYQRARYLAFEEFLHRRVEEMRREQDGRGMRGGPPGPPRGRGAGPPPQQQRVPPPGR